MLLSTLPSAAQASSSVKARSCPARISSRAVRRAQAWALGHVSTPTHSVSHSAHRARSDRRRCCRAAASAAPAATTTSSLPQTPLNMVEQAAAAVKQAIEAGQGRQQLTLLLPVNEKEANFMSTEPIDYPCSLQKEFDTCVALTKSVLQRVLGAAVNINSKRIDDGGVEGEPCTVLYPDDKKFAAVVFPTADRLKNIQAYAKEEGRTLLIVNPQWNLTQGQVVSDFGFGPWRKAADDFLATFKPTYVLKEKRIGSPGTVNASTGTRFVTGGVVRVLRRYPGTYEAYAMAADGSSQLLGVSESEPTYKELDAMIVQGRKAKLEIFEIAKRVTYVFEDGSDLQEAAEQPGAGVAEGAPVGGDNGEVELGSLSDTDIEAMDGATLRRRLTRLGLPTSGKMSKLRERLREARDKA